MHIPQNKGKPAYVYQLGVTLTFNPVDGTTYFIGENGSVNTVEGIARTYIVRTGTIKKCYIAFFQTAGSAETSSIFIRVNNTTDTLVSNAIINNATNTSFNNTNLSISVNEGDYIELKWTTPTWNANPTGLILTSSIYIEGQ